MDVKQHWNDRAALGVRAGTDDLIAAELERRAIARYVKDGMRVLDVGCGNGTTAIELARKLDINIMGVDYSHEMIAAAERQLYEHRDAGHLLNPGKLCFVQGDVLDSWDMDQCDLIYTQRCLINLPTWEAQQQAIRNILGLLKPGGLAVLCECCQEGLEEINDLRVAVGLEPIKPPLHNRYILEDEMLGLIDRVPAELGFSTALTGTYAFLSRVVNAWLAKQEGREPSYDAPINQLALELPQGSLIPFVGQQHLWVWGKK